MKRRAPLPQRAARMLARLKSVRGLSDADKSVYALGLAATPEERWELVENLIRSLGYWKPLKPGKSASSANTARLKLPGKKISVLKLERILKSKESIRRDKDLPHICQIRNLLRCRPALEPQRNSGSARRRPRH